MPMKTYGDLQVSDESCGCPSSYCSSLPFAECSRINSTQDSSSTSCSSASSGCTVVSSAGLKLYYCNSRSLLPKLDELKIMIQSEKPDLLAFTETWLHPGIAESKVCLEGYRLFRHDRDGESISVSKVGRSLKLEFMSVVLSLKSGPLQVCVHYRPPSTDSSLDLLEAAIQDLDISASKPCVIVGDFKVDLLKIDEQLPMNLLGVTSSFGLSQLVHEPTRVCASSSSLIDHVYASASPSISSLLVGSVGVI